MRRCKTAVPTSFLANTKYESQPACTARAWCVRADIIMVLEIAPESVEGMKVNELKDAPDGARP